MNAQTVVKARRVNNNEKPLGEHMTLTKVVNDSAAQKYFGFAMSDTGEECYVPASLIRNQQMTEHDVGAGFTCILKQNAGFEQDHGRVCTPPLKWDGDAEEIEVEVGEPEPVISQEDLDTIEGDLHDLAEKAEDMVIQTSTNMSAAIADLKALDVKAALNRLQNAVDQVESFRSVINEIAPSES